VSAVGIVSVNRGGAQDDADTSAKLESLLRERRDTLRQLVQVVGVHYRDGRTTEDAVVCANNRLLEAELDLLTAKAERIAVYEQLVENMRRLEEVAAARHEVGVGSIEEVLAAKAARLRAEIELVRMKAQDD
jgi:outer membrane protein TolC